MSGFRLWRRWDPRLEAMPLREVLRTNRWCVEVVPDLFEVGNETLRDAVLHAIGQIEPRTQGRFLLRTAFPGRALEKLRELADTYEMGGRHARELRSIPDRCILAVYAETQAELDARVAELRTPRVLYERLALTDMDAAIALALKEHAISTSYKHEEWKAAKEKGPAALSSYLKGVCRRDRHEGFCVAEGGLALYLSPREKIDMRSVLETVAAETKDFHAKYGENCSYCSDHEGSHAPPKQFDWILVAGQIGPIGKDETAGPWPIHPTWITDIAATAKDFKLPFCVPHLGEWACYDKRSWDGDQTICHGMDSSDRLHGGRDERLHRRDVDYDPSWAWGERGWDNDRRDAKPSSAYMESIGSHLVGRALVGRIFDEWPRGWARY